MPEPAGDLLVRKAEPEDVASLVELRRYLLDEGSGHYVAHSDGDRRAWRASYRKWLEAHIGQSPSVRVAVAARRAGKILGCGVGIIDQRAPMAGCLNGRVGWLQTIVVEPAYRGDGVGKAVVEHLLGWLATNEVGKVALQTTPVAARLYDKLGFVNSGEELLLKQIRVP